MLHSASSSQYLKVPCHVHFLEFECKKWRCKKWRCNATVQLFWLPGCQNSVGSELHVNELWIQHGVSACDSCVLKRLSGLLLSICKHDICPSIDSCSCAFLSVSFSLSWCLVFALCQSTVTRTSEYWKFSSIVGIGYKCSCFGTKDAEQRILEIGNRFGLQNLESIQYLKIQLLIAFVNDTVYRVSGL